MASAFALSPREARRLPTIKFEIDTNSELASTEILSDFLFYFEQCFKSYARVSNFEDKYDGLFILDLSVGSVIGELVAKFIDNVSFSDIRSFLAGFFPFINDSIDIIRMNKSTQLTRETQGFFAFIQNSFNLGGFLNIHIKINNYHPSQFIYIDNETFSALKSNASHINDGKTPYSDRPIDTSTISTVTNIGGEWLIRPNQRGPYFPIVLENPVLSVVSNDNRLDNIMHSFKSDRFQAKVHGYFDEHPRTSSTVFVLTSIESIDEDG